MRRLSTARPGRTARLLLLLATLVGLAAMHTLGHGATAHAATAHAATASMPGHGPSAAVEMTGQNTAATAPDAVAGTGHGTAMTALAAAAGTGQGAAMTALAAAAVSGPDAQTGPAAAVPRRSCPDGHCARLLGPPGRHPAGMDWWDVCLAVLTALGVLLLWCWLVAVVSRRRAPDLTRARTGPASRGPPVPRFGLTLTTVSVMRH